MGSSSRIALMIGIALSARPALAAPPGKPGTQAPQVKTLAQTLTGQAKADYDSARLLINDGDYAGALIKFQAAYEASKDPRLLWNVAASEKQLRHYARAVELLKAFRADSGPYVSAAEKAEAADLIRTLEPFTVSVTLDVNEADATVEIDDRPRGKTPLPGPVVVDIGQRKIRVHKDGFRDFTTTTSVGGDTQQTIVVKLEKEVHEGKLSLVVPAGATVLIDGQPVAGKPGEPIEAKLPSGGHTLRVTAPGMRVYEREIGVRDNETRVVEVALERETQDKPRLRVAVGCGDAEPRGTEDGLGIVVDGVPVVAAGAKKAWNAQQGRERVEYLEFPVDSGLHRVVVSAAGCVPEEAAVAVSQTQGATLAGALRTESSFFDRGPAGKPDWWRLALGVWFPNTSGDNAQISDAGGNKFNYHAGAIGVHVSPAVVFQWFSLALDFGFASGSATFKGGQTPPSEGSAPGVTWVRTGVRAGARLPLHWVTLSLGPGFGYNSTSLEHLPRGFSADQAQFAYVSGWLGLDINLLCDWALYAVNDVDAALGGERGIAFFSGQVGIAFQPNRSCRRERNTSFGLTPK